MIQAKMSNLRTDVDVDGMSPWLLKEIQEFEIQEFLVFRLFSDEEVT